MLQFWRSGVDGRSTDVSPSSDFILWDVKVAQCEKMEFVNGEEIFDMTEKGERLWTLSLYPNAGMQPINC
jgi:hypothetical protein